MIWSSTEKILYIISNDRGEIPRDGVLLYAKPYSGQIEKIITNGSINLENEESLADLLKKVQLESRFFGINYDNVGKSKNTIEFRLANGTVNADTWIQNINLFGGIVRAAEDLAKIQTKPKKERTENEIVLLQNFEKLRDKSIGELERLEAFLELVIIEENRDIYRERYSINSILFERAEIEKRISEGISRNINSLKNTKKKYDNIIEK